MKPTQFKESNVIFGAKQPEYLPLPAWTDGSEVITCWRLGWIERISLLFTGRLWLRTLTFGSALQPQLPAIKRPFLVTKTRKS